MSRESSGVQRERCNDLLAAAFPFNDMLACPHKRLEEAAGPLRMDK